MNHMGYFELIDVEPSATPQALPPRLRGGSNSKAKLVDTDQIIEDLNKICASLNSHVTTPSNKNHLELKRITLKLALTTEGRIAFLAKAGAEATIEATFELHQSSEDIR